MSDRNTRKSTLLEEIKSIRYFYLKPMEHFNDCQLPTNRDILQRFFWIQDHGNKLKPKKEIALEIYNELCLKYAMIPCPMKGKQYCIKVILNLDSEYYNVAKNIKNYKSEKPDIKISVFKSKLEKLCDLSAPNAPEVIMKDSSRTPSQRIEDCEFLKDQQKKVYQNLHHF